MTKGGAKLHIMVQLAEPGDIVDNSSIHWPESRTQVEFGIIQLSGIVPNNAEAQRDIIFDPIPRVDGIDASGDPLLEPRSVVYLTSGRRRRASIGK